MQSIKSLLQNIKLLTAIVFTSAALSSCSVIGGSQSTDPLDTALESFEQKDYTSATEILDGTRQSVLQSNDVARLVRMSILYMKLSDVNDSEELVGYAYQCMAQAYKTDSTATADFINTLPVDDMSQASAVKTIIGASGMMSFHDDGELLDSLFNNTEEQPKQ